MSSANALIQELHDYPAWDTLTLQGPYTSERAHSTAIKGNSTIPLHRLPVDLFYSVLDFVLAPEELSPRSYQSFFHLRSGQELLYLDAKKGNGSRSKRKRMIRDTRVTEYLFDTNALLVCRYWNDVGRSILNAHFNRRRRERQQQQSRDDYDQLDRSSWLIVTHFTHRTLSGSKISQRQLPKLQRPLVHLTLKPDADGFEFMLPGPFLAERASSLFNEMTLVDLIRTFDIRSLELHLPRWTDIFPPYIPSNQNPMKSSSSDGINNDDTIYPHRPIDFCYHYQARTRIFTFIAFIDYIATCYTHLLPCIPGFADPTKSPISIVVPNLPQYSNLATSKVHAHLARLRQSNPSLKRPVEPLDPACSSTSNYQHIYEHRQSPAARFRRALAIARQRHLNTAQRNENGEYNAWLPIRCRSSAIAPTSQDLSDTLIQVPARGGKAVRETVQRRGGGGVGCMCASETLSATLCVCMACRHAIPEPGLGYEFREHDERRLQLTASRVLYEVPRVEIPLDGEEAYFVRRELPWDDEYFGDGEIEYSGDAEQGLEESEGGIQETEDEENEMEAEDEVGDAGEDVVNNMFDFHVVHSVYFDFRVVHSVYFDFRVVHSGYWHDTEPLE